MVENNLIEIGIYDDGESLAMVWAEGCISNRSQYPLKIEEENLNYFENNSCKCLTYTYKTTPIY